MREALRLHPAVQLTFVDHDRVQVGVLGDQVTVQQGARLVAALLPLCDGTRSEPEVQSALQHAGHDGTQVAALLHFLRGRGCFTPYGHVATTDPVAAHIDWLAARQPADAYDNRLTHQQPGQVGVRIPTAGLLSDTLADALQPLGFEVCRTPHATPRASHVALHCTDWDDHATALQHNQQVVADGTPTLFAALGEARARVGPFVLPGETPCYACFHHRMRGSMRFTDEFDRRVGLPHADAPGAGLPARHGPSRLCATVVAGVVCTELLKYLRKLTVGSLLGRVLEIDLLRYQMDASRVLRLPRCPVCGSGRAHAAPTLAVRDLL